MWLLIRENSLIFLVCCTYRFWIWPSWGNVQLWALAWNIRFQTVCCTSSWRMKTYSGKWPNPSSGWNHGINGKGKDGRWKRNSRSNGWTTIWCLRYHCIRQVQTVSWFTPLAFLTKMKMYTESDIDKILNQALKHACERLVKYGIRWWHILIPQ